MAKNLFLRMDGSAGVPPALLKCDRDGYGPMSAMLAGQGSAGLSNWVWTAGVKSKLCFRKTF